MAARTGMNDARALRVLSGSFVAGVLCAAAVSAAMQGDGGTGPYFGLEEPTADVTSAPETPPPANPPAVSAQQPPAAKPAVGDLSRLAEALASTPPERLALEEGAAAPQAALLMAQALPGARPVATA
ncbi:MAG: hypothetical protein WCC69_09925, partial [Pirellulales bacterium]